jgi:hypothetical protein
MRQGIEGYAYWAMPAGLNVVPLAGMTSAFSTLVFCDDKNFIQSVAEKGFS